MHPVAVSRSGLLLASDLRRLGYDARNLQRAAATGKLLRLLRGAYVERDVWAGAEASERHILRLQAVDGTRTTQNVFSHVSAAALHGLPILGSWPTSAHVSSDAPGRSRNGVLFHQAIKGRTPTVIQGLACTSLVDTLVDLGRGLSFSSAVVSIDHALHAAAEAAALNRRSAGANAEASAAAAEVKAQLLEALHRFAPPRNFRRSLTAIEFATHLADSPGESLSRCGIHLLGFPAPELQHEFHDYLGFIGRGDFWWDHVRLLGEFDGEDKYKNPAFLRGRTPHQALVDEKRREDRIRATRVGVSRWDWKTAFDLPQLYAKLFAAGLRPLR